MVGEKSRQHPQNELLLFFYFFSGTDFPLIKFKNEVEVTIKKMFPSSVLSDEIVKQYDDISKMVKKTNKRDFLLSFIDILIKVITSSEQDLDLFPRPNLDGPKRHEKVFFNPLVDIFNIISSTE